MVLLAMCNLPLTGLKVGKNKCRYGSFPFIPFLPSTFECGLKNKCKLEPKMIVK